MCNDSIIRQIYRIGTHYRKISKKVIKDNKDIDLTFARGVEYGINKLLKELINQVKNFKNIDSDALKKLQNFIISNKRFKVEISLNAENLEADDWVLGIWDYEKEKAVFSNSNKDLSKLIKNGLDKIESYE